MPTSLAPAQLYLKESGVHPKLAQSLARHSDIRLTLNVYTHPDSPALAADHITLPLGRADVPSGPPPQFAGLSRRQLEEWAVAGWVLAHLLACGDLPAPLVAPVVAPNSGTASVDFTGL